MNKITNKGFLNVPVAIVVAGIIVAIAIIYSSGPKAPSQAGSNNDLGGGEVVDNIKPVSNNDHILGDKNAPVKIIEFSDISCPFCKRFHPTLQQALNDYDGKVAWIYRHFPLDSIHPMARSQAEATECAAEQGGNDSFWNYLDKLFESQPQTISGIVNAAAEIGLDAARLEACLNSNKYAQRVEDDYQDAIASGGRGTPFSVVIAPNGEKLIISGAQPYSSVKATIEQALQLK